MTAQPPPPPNSPGHSQHPHVCILLALYQGAPFLQEQLDSFVDQTHANWSILASDDGSEDRTLEIFHAFAATHPTHQIVLQSGARQGFVRNFFSLLRNAPDTADYVALSDQDDIWFPDKLARAVVQLSQVPTTQPGLYCARTQITDAALTPLGLSPHFPKAPGFRNALVQSIGGGNTMVLNRAALELVQAVIPDTPSPVAHDWWLYQLITGCGGQIIRDPEPGLSYRQHGNNLIGANLSSPAQGARLLALLQGRFRHWNTVGLAALEPSAQRFTPEAQDTLAHYKAARHGTILQRLRHLRRSRVYRQGGLGTLALYLACVINRL